MSVAVIAEKPSVARDIAAVLGAKSRADGSFSGNGYVVTWAVGHLVGIAEPHQINPGWKQWRWDALPMLPSQWPLVVLDSTKTQFEAVRRILQSPEVKEVICATDAGREGELIFRQLYEAAGCRKPFKRLWISSLTEDAIRDGFRKLKPGRELDPLADAAVGRSRADWIVGMNLSRAYGLTLDGPLSVGRVQTPTLAMIVERELSIRKFVPEEFLEVVGTFSPRGGARFDGIWFRMDGKEQVRRLSPDGKEARAVVERVLGGDAVIETTDVETKRMPPPLLYDLTELQRHSNRLFGYSAKRCLEVAQSLYEKHKLISYPRTSSRHLSTEVATQLSAIVRAVAPPYQTLISAGTGERPLSRRFVDDSRVTDHHAIIPTTSAGRSGQLSPEERNVYDLICRRFLSAWQGDFIWDATRVVTAVHSSLVDRFASHGTALRELGWKALDKGSSTPPPDKPGEQVQALPSGLSATLPLDVHDVRSVAKKTQPPRRFTDATLLTAMETAGKTLDEKELSDAMRENGLGTPATRAAIIETLLARKYLIRAGKTLEPTDRGIELIAAVDPSVKSPQMTGEWEARLQRIERRQGELSPFLAGIEAYVREVLSRMSPPRGGAPKVDPRQGSLFDPPTPASAPNVVRTQAAVAPARNVGGEVRPPVQKADPPRPSSERPPVRITSATLPPPGNGLSSGQRDIPGGNGFSPTPRDISGGAQRASSPPHSRSNAAADANRLARPTSPPQGSSTRTLAAAPANELRPAFAGQRSPVAPEKLEALLHEVFGFATFRPHQKVVCESATRGEDLLLVMPTGAGKSLCYQLPGIARGGTTLVISPLIALMEDQVARLRTLGLRAERIHSGRDRAESRDVVQRYLDGALDFLFVAPERLGVPGFIERLAGRKPSLIAIDEAHCISQWGHDFRPDYRLLGQRLPQLRPAPVIALTATATPVVQKDIVEQLGISAGHAFIHGFRRDNLAIEAVELKPADRPERVRALLKDSARRPAIVYAPSRKSAEAVAEELSADFAAEAYHAGLGAKLRDDIQTRFLTGKLEVIVATIAFGMGVDKADIRTVIHLALPGSVEGYYQEIGRAGRDGKPSRAILMHSYADRRTHEFFHERDYPEPAELDRIFGELSKTPVDREALRANARMDPDTFEKALDKLWVHGGVLVSMNDELTVGTPDWERPYLAQRARRLEQLAQMARFAEGQSCRMLHLVGHFGDREDSGVACGHCDICAPDKCAAASFRSVGGEDQRILASILDALDESDGQGTGRLCKLCVGETPDDRRRFDALLGALVRGGLVRVSADSFEKDGKRINFTRASLTDLGKGERDLSELVIPNVEPSSGRSSKKSKRGKGRASRAPERSRGPVSASLVEALKGWRLQESRKRKIPAFRILTDRVLSAVAELRPASESELLQISGIGPKIAEQYGAKLIALCR